MATPQTAAVPPKLKVFFASSTAAKPMVNALVAELDDRFEAIRWWDTPANGVYIRDSLLDQVKSVDAAVMLFSADDAFADGELVTRDNVLFEYGMFTGRLDVERVAVIQQEGIRIPTDLGGIINLTFPSGTDVHASMKLNADKLAKRWGGLPPRDIEPGEQLRLRETIRNEDVRHAQLRSRVMARGSKATAVSIGSEAATIDAYAEALDHVCERFWTTSMLTSGFWNKPNARVLAANQRMVKQLRAAGGTACRLFLLQRPLEDEVRLAKEERILLRQRGETARAGRLDDEFQRLRQNMIALIKDGFDVRVHYDDGRFAGQLPSELRWDRRDSELALYDRFRVDVFAGGSTGRISTVQCYGTNLPDFDGYLAVTEQYFEGMWRDAAPADEFLDRMDSALNAAKTHINYEPNWLAHYEFWLPSEDVALKAAEMVYVRETLRRLGRWGSVRSYLDIGTCTGRYPIGLGAALHPEGAALGIDADDDCVRFARMNVAASDRVDERATIAKSDFLVNRQRGRYDLITCMLGTISHFAYDRDADGTSRQLAAALVTMRDLLERDGHLLIGAWSDEAVAQQRLLSIYQRYDAARLSRWSPREAELRNLLSTGGLKVVDHSHVDERLDVWVATTA